MARPKANTHWRVEQEGLDTNPMQVREALTNQKEFKKLMKRHQVPTLRYLDWFLLHHRIVEDAAARETAIKEIWDAAKAAMPQQLVEQWSKGHITFRDLLAETVHAEVHSWQIIREYKPEIDRPVSPMRDDDDEYLRCLRQEILDRARERLRLSVGGGNAEHYQAFKVWDDDKKATNFLLGQQLGRMTGHWLGEVTLRKILSRMRDRFGIFLGEEVKQAMTCNSEYNDRFCRYLAEEVECDFRKNGDFSVEQLRDAFERLNLMEEYVQKSKYLRFLLEMPSGVDRSRTER